MKIKIAVLYGLGVVVGTFLGSHDGFVSALLKALIWPIMLVKSLFNVL